jgi:two-component system chemotaxis response regulator CheB
MELGALDFIPKGPAGSDMGWIQRDLPAKLKALARRKAYIRLVHRKSLAPPSPAALHTAPHATPSAPPAARRSMPAVFAGSGFRYDVVAIGVSTGGPPAVQKILSDIPGAFPVPILIAQHMPATFTGPFAARLDTQSQISVKEAAPLERVRAGTAYICPGGKHLRLENRKGTLTAVVTEEPKDALYKPSANVLMETVGLALGPRALCVMLTGMGSDGLEGTKILKSKGGYAIAQSEATCVVYGMPKALVDFNLADEIVDLDDIAAAIVSAVVR